MRRQRPGWSPARLRERREALGLTLEAAGEALRKVAMASGLAVPAANFQTIWSHEHGSVYPGPHYRRAYCLLFEATEPELGFRYPGPGEEQQPVLGRRSARLSGSVEESFARLLGAGSSQENKPARDLVARAVAGWRRRYDGGNSEPASLTLVGGYAGCGKSEFARFLSTVTGWVLLDKDSLTRPLVEGLLVSLGADPHDRHSALYRERVRPLEYRCLQDVVYDNLDCGISTVVAAPFLRELTDEGWTRRLMNRCRSSEVRISVVWVDCDTESMRDHLEFRAAARDGWKLANWDEYLKSLDPGLRPHGEHLVVDNQFGAAVAACDQLRGLLPGVAR